MGISGSGIAGPYIGKGVSLPFGVGLDSIVDYSQPIRDSNFIKDGVLDSTIAHSGGENGTLFDASGNLVFPPHNEIRNNTMVGAATGTPGTLPTNWTVSSIAGLTQEVVAVGTTNGIATIDIRLSGTPGADPQFEFDTTTGINALTGETWTFSPYLAIVAGDFTNIANVFLRHIEYTDVGGLVLRNTSSDIKASITSTLQRLDYTATLSGGVTTKRILPTILIDWDGSGAIDITLRIGLPQQNRGPTALAVVKTTNAAVWAARFGYFYTGSIWVPKGVGPIELEGKNEIRNNTMVGASPGTPGDLPNNWSIGTGGLTQEIVAVGPINGITTFDLRLFGTPSSSPQLSLEDDNVIDALNGQTWTFATYLAIVGGDLTNITSILFQVNENNEAGSFIRSSSEAIVGLSSTIQRFSFTGTLSGGGLVAHITPILRVIWDNSGDIDLTLRIGIPKEAKEPFVTSDILTTTAAVTRDAETYTRTVQHRDEFTILLKGRTAAGSGEQVFFQVDDGDENERARIVRNASNEMRFIVTDGGVDQCDLNLGTVADDTDFAVAVRAKASDFAGSLDGAALVTDTGGTMPAGLVNERFGHDSAGNQCGGHIARVVDWDQPHLDNVLQRLPL